MAYPQESFVWTKLSAGSLLRGRRDAVASNTLLYQLEVLKKTGRYDAFKLKWHSSYSDPPEVWPVPNHLFWDSDVAKWLEGACYFLHEQRHSKIEVAVQELVDMIRNAQQPDGYLNIHFTVVAPGQRFTNLRDMHEMYNAGHLIEAALAHQHLYKNDQLLEPLVKYVDLLCKTFGPADDQVHGYPGHPEIELALLRLYKRTGNVKALRLAEYFISERGNPTGSQGKHYYVAEAEARGENGPSQRPTYWPEVDSLWYYQAHKPISKQETIEGHSVRAMYLLTAVADLIDQQEQDRQQECELLSAVQRLWRNMIDKKMYLTGGIGAIKKWEGFGIDYFLPQGTDEGGCYSETCAAIGVMMLAERLLQINLDGELGDIMELCLYNAVLTAMSYDGTAFTYVNQLASSDQDLSKREEWFTCACCPPNIMRLLGQIGGYATTFRAESAKKSAQINVHLFLSSVSCFETASGTIELTQETKWPWSGDVSFNLKGASKDVVLNIRIPSWAQDWELSPSAQGANVNNGYLSLTPEWLSSHSSFKLSIPLISRRVSPHPYTNQNTITIARGPIIYCVEDFDNPWVKDHFKSVQLNDDCQIIEENTFDKHTGETYVRLTVKNGASMLPKISAQPEIERTVLNSATANAEAIEELYFVPYYFRANRGGRGQMRVGLRRR